MKCPVCQVHDIRSIDPDVTACVDCVRTGRQMEFFLTQPVRSNVLGRIRLLDNVMTANLWPSQPGCFHLGIFLTDGRLVLTGGAIEAAPDTYIAAPVIPPLGQKWMFGVRTPQEGAIDEWEAGDAELAEGVWDDDELVVQIAELGGADAGVS